MNPIFNGLACIVEASIMKTLIECKLQWKGRVGHEEQTTSQTSIDHGSHRLYADGTVFGHQKEHEPEGIPYEGSIHLIDRSISNGDTDGRGTRVGDLRL